MSDATPRTAFSFTKLVVEDLEASARFYQTVCGLSERARHEGRINGRPVTEITFHPSTEDGPSLTLLTYDDDGGLAPGESMLGFTTDDLDAFVQRAEAAGGRLTDPVRDVPAYNVRVAFVEDNAGHLIEVIQAL